MPEEPLILNAGGESFTFKSLAELIVWVECESKFWNGLFVPETEAWDAQIRGIKGTLDGVLTQLASFRSLDDVRKSGIPQILESIRIVQESDAGRIVALAKPKGYRAGIASAVGLLEDDGAVNRAA